VMGNQEREGFPVLCFNSSEDLVQAWHLSLLGLLLT